MKIIYSAGNRCGANIQLKRFLENVSANHEIKIAAYVKSSTSLKHIDWTLDSLYYNILGTKKKQKLKDLFQYDVPSVNFKNASILVQEIIKFDPDLIISDGEFFVPVIAKLIKKPIYYCSPLHLLDGIKWDYGTLEYLYFFKKTLKYLKSFPKGDKYFVYSNFGDIKFRPFLKPNYEWVTPYTNNQNDKLYFSDLDRLNKIKKICEFVDIPNNFTLNDGDTNYLSDMFYKNINIIVSPTIGNAENLINACLVKKFNIGTDISQFELMDIYSLDVLSDAINNKYINDFVSLQNYPKLHERVEEYAYSL